MTQGDNTAQFSGEEARRLMRAARTGSLASILPNGTPYASLVNTATDSAGRPIILISGLAWHTRNLEADGRASLLFIGEGVFADALEGPRATAIGRFAPSDEETLRQRFLARHPRAAFYAGFKDFSFWRMEIEQVHAVAGFGRIETLEASAVLLVSETVERIERLREEAVDHLNNDHKEALGLYATRLLGAPAAEWRAASLDADGLDLIDGENNLRLGFPQPVRNAAELRTTLKALADEARRR